MLHLQIKKRNLSWRNRAWWKERHICKYLNATTKKYTSYYEGRDEKNSAQLKGKVVEKYRCTEYATQPEIQSQINISEYKNETPWRLLDVVQEKGHLSH